MSTLILAATTMINDDMDRDTIIITLVTEEGATLNAATKAYAAAARDLGLTSATTSRKEEAMEWLYEEYPLEDWNHEGVASAVIEVASQFEVAESTARDYCKAHSKLLGVDHPVFNPRLAMFEWLKENDGRDIDEMKEAFKTFGKAIGRSSSNINEYWKGYELHLFLTA